MNAHPLAYLITFRTYASWLHGDHRQSVDPRHNIFLTPKIKPNHPLKQNMQQRCRETEYIIEDKNQQSLVLKSIIDTSHNANWHLYAAHVRTNHIHIVTQLNIPVDRATTSFKAYATRYLKRSNPQSTRCKYWARGQSAKPIFEEINLLRAMQYVIEEQGERMALYYDKDFYDVD